MDNEKTSAVTRLVTDVDRAVWVTRTTARSTLIGPGPAYRFWKSYPAQGLTERRSFQAQARRILYIAMLSACAQPRLGRGALDTTLRAELDDTRCRQHDGHRDRRMPVPNEPDEQRTFRFA